MRRFWVTVLVILVIAAVLLLFVNPFSMTVKNAWIYNVRKADDATNYVTRKQVEDTCRAMITSYTSDKLRYEQYASSPNPEQRSWGEQAKMRANATAAQYNEYVLKNSFVFNGNVPNDICAELEYLS